MAIAEPGVRWRSIVPLVLIAATLIATAAYFAFGPAMSGSDPLAAGRAAYAAGDWSVALARAREALKRDARDPAAARLLARSCARLGNDRLALELYGRPTFLQPEPEDHYLRGVLLARHGRNAEAEAEFTAALAADPDHTATLSFLADRRAAEGRLDEAAAIVTKLERIPALSAEAALRRGVIQAELNDPRGAVQALRRGLGAKGLDPGRVTPFRKLLARALLQLGRPDEAIRELNSITPPDPETSWLISRADIQRGRGPSAAEAFIRAGSYRAEHELEPEPSPYVGSAACVDCHKGISETHFSSRHSRSFHRGNELVKLPRPEAPVPDPGDPSVLHDIGLDGDSVVDRVHIDGKVVKLLVEYAFGTPERYVEMAARDPAGKPRALRVSHFIGDDGQGWGLSSGDVTRPPDRDGYLGREVAVRDGAMRCLACHTTNVRGGTDRVGPETPDRGIGCEGCHGPGKNHLEAIRLKLTDRAIVSPAAASADGMTRMCGRCHVVHDPKMAESKPRDDPAWARSPGTTLTWSKCYTSSGGALTCVTCHDPHRDADPRKETYAAKCLACHSGAVSANSTIAAALPDDMKRVPCPRNPTGDCISCHMPPVRDPSRHRSLSDHYIRVHK